MDRSERRCALPPETIRDHTQPTARSRKTSTLRKGNITRSFLIGQNFPNGERGRTAGKVGKAIGMSGRTCQQAKAVSEAAEEEPEVFGPIVEEMDRTGSVSGALNKMNEIKRNKREVTSAKGRQRPRSASHDATSIVVVHDLHRERQWEVVRVGLAEVRLRLQVRMQRKRIRV